ncbi:HAD family hydrolase [Leptospira brenneri]|uniref:HAD family hydrolase n=1 Tax=Leptospira brenneri TaxID=2023182 RepID=UPI0013FDEC05|nr:HAD hydrolase-like protein [Leptospira brenneri]
MKKIPKAINTYKVLFWDFDGVIKESVDVKTQAYIKLFENFGSEIAEKVKQHHIANGGMSRFEKIPIYGKFAGIEFDNKQISEYSEKFSKLALQGVLDSEWVPGVESYIRSNQHKQIFIVVSATPQDELNSILHSLKLSSCFNTIYGAPLSKSVAIATSLRNLDVTTSDCLMIGDALADLEAANSNNIDFILRLHSFNQEIFTNYTGTSIYNFSEL